MPATVRVTSHPETPEFTADRVLLLLCHFEPFRLDMQQFGHPTEDKVNPHLALLAAVELLRHVAVYGSSATAHMAQNMIRAGGVVNVS